MDFTFLNTFKDVRLLVAGEVGIDQYIWGDTRRISPEAPVPIVEVNSEDYKLGLSANVASNIVSLGGNATLVTVRGEDKDGELLEKMVNHNGIQKSIFVSDPTRPTLRKVRIIAQKQHVVRVDYEKCHVLGANVTRNFNECLNDLLPSHDGVILQDYGKGIWTPDTVEFIKHAVRLKKPVFVDPSRLSSPSLYRGATLLTPNIVEAEILCGLDHFIGRPAAKLQRPKSLHHTLKLNVSSIGRPAAKLQRPKSLHHTLKLNVSSIVKQAGLDDLYLSRLAKKLLIATEAQHMIITCGSWGMVSLSQDGEILQRIPTFARDVYDVTGAGDTVIALIALMMTGGYPLNQCMEIANAAAGIVVGKIGTACVNPEELKQELERLHQVGLLK